MSKVNKQVNRRKTKIVILGFVVLVVAATICTLFLVKNDNKYGDKIIDLLSFAKTDVCGNAVIKEYGQVQALSDAAFDTSFLKLEKDIKSNQNYKKDVDCMYILTNYYVYTHNSASARSSYSGLKALISDGKTINSDLQKSSDITDLDSIEQRIKDIEASSSMSGDKG